MRQINKLCFASLFAFILGCSLSLAVYSNYISLQCDESLNLLGKSLKKIKKDTRSTNSFQYLILIFSKPNNFEQRTVIRETWLKLLPNRHIYYESYKEKWAHYFVIGTRKLPDEKVVELNKESKEFGDILFLHQLKDEYSSLSMKLLESLKHIYENNTNLLYLLKCDDDSFVRVDLIIKELHIIRRNALNLEGKQQNNELDQRFKKFNMPSIGLYWGYFKGNAHVQKKGKWNEKDFFLCDRYLPYAQGGGYVLSYDVVEFIAKNACYLKLYASEDVSVGVWTAPLSNVNRLHDKRFDTEWVSRGCDDTMLIRHKQSPEDMRELYQTLSQSGNIRLCSKPSFLRGSYDYNWTVLPSHCCDL